MEVEERNGGEEAPDGSLAGDVPMVDSSRKNELEQDQDEQTRRKKGTSPVGAWLTLLQLM